MCVGFRELTEDQIDQISARIMPRARSSIRVSDLLVPLRKFKALTDTEYGHLRSGSLEAEEQAVRLMEYLTYKGSYGLAALYLSLLTSSESKRGLPAHYQLAGELRDIGKTIADVGLEIHRCYKINLAVVYKKGEWWYVHKYAHG